MMTVEELAHQSPLQAAIVLEVQRFAPAWCRRADLERHLLAAGLMAGQSPAAVRIAIQKSLNAIDKKLPHMPGPDGAILTLERRRSLGLRLVPRQLGRLTLEDRIEALERRMAELERSR